MPNKLLSMMPMKKHLLLPVVFFAFTACHESKAPIENSTATAPPPQETPAKQDAVANATESKSQISTPCAIFYSPDSIQLAKLKKDNGEEAFYTIADDYQNYMTDARIFLEGKGVKILEPTGGKISFLSKSGSKTTLNLSDIKYSWEVWLFDGNALHKADVTDFEDEYHRYMK
ncbi:hypothetical protein CLV51_1021111 [Chitinophaga niastensis]|uniref:Lipoprotein n=1 Tax=Chitinophaga niastensis TaxID=536980 RepID=A0A2P8HPW5_CHINA|nr:hypothetical protein [Chitinophaga niastensis]PSL48246.1 hypothetical protein CLV51_1021111 [Chitinophaga niastensis]